MTVGLILLLAVSVVVFLGFAHRVLDRMHLNDKQALVAVLLILLGGFVDIPIYRGLWTISLNLGGSVIPVIIAIYVLSRADTPSETGRGIFSAVATGAALVAISKVFTFEEGRTIIDSIYVFGLVAGAIAYLLGRSRRAAFVGAVLGVVLLDIAHLVEVIVRRIPSTVNLGGAGAFDAVIIAGIIAVGLAEIFGETMERLQRGHIPDSKGNADKVSEAVSHEAETLSEESEE
ncbi:MAG: DUF1614 domain-containing protein [Firmicutes bacterium]|nr:DUF1614 domain-containing protein [Bacillota bacterium]